MLVRSVLKQLGSINNIQRVCSRERSFCSSSSFPVNSSIRSVGSFWSLQQHPIELRTCSTSSLRTRLTIGSVTFVPQRNMSTTAPKYYAKEEGQRDTKEYRVFITDSQGKKIAPWHDVPLFASSKGFEGNTFNFLNEIPRGTNAKMEMAADEPFTPIKQDIKKGQLRYLKHGNVLHNYGCFPQTWENPKEIHPATNLPGDGDPVDVIEIGSRNAKIGDIYPVKALGVLALIDEGETDWKIIAIAVDDPKAALVNDVSDVEKQMPGVIDAVREWYRVYKVVDGKPPNEYALNGSANNKDFAIEVIKDTHRCYNEAHKKPTSKL
eukprot:TRINITY_DN8206_c0_g1_i1.p1 TRINITY_DN8206_c0_g1~~TRINITY_DN8206_c0_g1_i1.p1  ORF type:complete len:331 (+),score=61.75 TRINITY_DN8206_c0_g1_i1:28-993(+)